MLLNYILRIKGTIVMIRDAFNGNVDKLYNNTSI